MTNHTPWVESIRAQFPILDNNPTVAYLDNSATSQKPTAVLDRIDEYSVTINANVARGAYAWASHTAHDLQAAEQTVCRALQSDGHITWTSGASDGLHRVATTIVGQNLVNGAEVIVPHADHGALLTAWQCAQHELAQRGLNISLVPMPYEPDSGDYDYRQLSELVTERTAVVNATSTHHVFGNNMNLHRLRPAIGEGPVVVVDAAQTIGHEPFYPATLGVDHLVFSGHKAYGPFGAGAIWSDAKHEDALTASHWAGTPNVTGVLGLAAGLEWAMECGLDRIHEWKQEVLIPLTDYLARSASYSVRGCQDSLLRESNVQRRSGICSFRHHTTKAQDVAFVLESHDLYVRADAHCQASNLGQNGPDPSVRVSVAPFTTHDEIQRLITALKEIE